MADTHPQTIEIKRYASRKLYNADAKEYVTLEDIAGYIRDGADVRIVDKQTGEDLTSQYLIQIIADRESQGEGALPIDVLTDLVRMYHQQTSALTPSFLSDAVEAFQMHQKKLADQPMNFLNAMEDWQNTQANMFKSAMSAWGMPKAQGAPDAAPKPAAKTEAKAGAKAKSTEKARDAKVEALEAQLKLLQEELSRLK